MRSGTGALWHRSTLRRIVENGTLQKDLDYEAKYEAKKNVGSCSRFTGGLQRPGTPPALCGAMSMGETSDIAAVAALQGRDLKPEDYEVLANLPRTLGTVPSTLRCIPAYVSAALPRRLASGGQCTICLECIPSESECIQLACPCEFHAHLNLPPHLFSGDASSRLSYLCTQDKTLEKKVVEEANRFISAKGLPCEERFGFTSEDFEQQSPGSLGDLSCMFNLKTTKELREIYLRVPAGTYRNLAKTQLVRNLTMIYRDIIVVPRLQPELVQSLIEQAACGGEADCLAKHPQAKRNAASGVAPKLSRTKRVAASEGVASAKKRGRAPCVVDETRQAPGVVDESGLVAGVVDESGLLADVVEGPGLLADPQDDAPGVVGESVFLADSQDEPRWLRSSR